MNDGVLICWIHAKCKQIAGTFINKKIPIKTCQGSWVKDEAMCKLDQLNMWTQKYELISQCPPNS